MIIAKSIEVLQKALETPSALMRQTVMRHKPQFC